ncbi:MAG: glutaredoxin 3 [Oligoflexia bacterium]|nr:glutaredoxin 3 [Oligoflexia bacterium]
MSQDTAAKNTAAENAAASSLPRSDRPIIIYKTARCPYCVAAYRYLREVKGIDDGDIAQVDLSTDHDARVELARVSGQRTVPQIWVRDQHVGGYDDLRALDAAGGLDILLS